MIKKPKAKGKRLENSVAEILTEIQNLRKDVIQRSQASGTFRFEYGGDIKFNVPLDNLKYLPLIECKNQEGQEQKHVFNFKNPVKDWYLSIKRKAEKIKNLTQKDTIPLLVISKNYEEVYVITEIMHIPGLLDYLKKNNNTFYIFIPEGFIIMKLKDFAKILDSPVIV